MTDQKYLKKLSRQEKIGQASATRLSIDRINFFVRLILFFSLSSENAVIIG